MHEMKKTSKVVTSTTMNTVQPTIARLIGKSNKGSLRIIVKEVKMFGKGRLYAEISHRIVDGKRIIKGALEYTTPGYERQDDTEVHIRCVCRATEKKYLFVGKTTPFKKQSDIVSEAPMHTRHSTIDTTQEAKLGHIGNTTVTSNSTANKGNQPAADNLLTPQPTVAAIETVQQADMAPTSQAERGKSPAVAIQKLQAELEFIGAMRKVGLDPDLKIRHVCVLLQESHASVYRKINLGKFPAPVRRGKSNFWPLSQIELYKSGEWAATSLAPPAAPDATPPTD